MKGIVITGVVALCAITATPAAALPQRYETTRHSDVYWTGFTACGQVEPTDVYSHDIKAKRPRVERGPALGSTLSNEFDDPIATVTAVRRIHARYGGVGIRWELTASHFLCDPEYVAWLQNEHAGDDDGNGIETGWATESRRFTVSYSVPVPRSRLQACGRVRMLYTRTTVESNGYVSTCRAGRAVARAWSRYQEADNGIHPQVKFTSAVTIRGYRCAAPSSDEYSLRMNCRKGRARVHWEWGD